MGRIDERVLRQYPEGGKNFKTADMFHLERHFGVSKRMKFSTFFITFWKKRYTKNLYCMPQTLPLWMMKSGNFPICCPFPEE